MSKKCCNNCTEKILKLKAQRDLYRTTLEEIDEAWDDSDMPLQRGNIYHRGIKMVLGKLKKS